jgi:hypothetical protein
MKSIIQVLSSGARLDYPGAAIIEELGSNTIAKIVCVPASGRAIDSMQALDLLAASGRFVDIVLNESERMVLLTLSAKAADNWNKLNEIGRYKRTFCNAVRNWCGEGVF